MNVALGTDGAIECGNLDLFEVIRFAAMSARQEGQDPTALPASAALMMATVTGAQAQGRSKECGMLQVGLDADAMSARQEGQDPTALPASAALMMATVTGAQAQGRSKECGMLQVGLDADIALLDFSAPHLMPCHNVLNGLVWSAKGGDVAMTMVRPAGFLRPPSDALPQRAQRPCLVCQGRRRGHDHGPGPDPLSERPFPHH